MSGELILRLIVGGLLILANGFFVAIEFALTRVRQYPESEFDTPQLRRAWEMTQELEIYLTSCQVGITASSIAVGIVAEPALASLFEPVFRNSVFASIGAGGLLAFIIINLLHLTHGEQTPTYLGVERTKFVVRYGATPLYWFAKAISPVIILGDGVAKWTLRRFGIKMTGEWLDTETDVIETRADLRHRLDQLLRRGELSAERQEEILRAFTVGDQPVRDIMTERRDIVYLSTTVSVEENLRRIGENPHTRLPLIGTSMRDFLGIVYVPAVVDRTDDLRGGAISFEEIATMPMTVPADMAISVAVDEFQSANQELALVMDPATEKVVGLVTATDAFEAVMGQLEDPLDVKLE